MVVKEVPSNPLMFRPQLFSSNESVMQQSRWLLRIRSMVDSKVI